jgi:hypothetical protein
MQKGTKALICRFQAEKVVQHLDFQKKGVRQEDIHLRAVAAGDIPYGSDEAAAAEVRSFHEATPWGEFPMTISNPNAIGFVLEGLDYYVEIRQVPIDKQMNQHAVEYWKEKGMIQED